MRKSFFLMSITFLYLLPMHPAQGQVLKRLANRAKQKLENKAGDKVDKGIDDAVDGSKKEKAPENSGGSENKNSGTADNSTGNEPPSNLPGTGNEVASNEPPSLKTYSKYDFVPGEKIIVAEDFSQDAIGDFPGKWNTNSSGEIVSASGKEGKWFQINKEGAFQPEFITRLPENFTLEFDLGTNQDFSFYSTELNLSFVNLDKPETEFSRWGSGSAWNNKHAVRFNIHPEDAGDTRGSSRIITSIDGTYILDNRVAVNEFFARKKNFAHLSFWRQNQRLRVYVNNEKIWDLPKAFGQGATYNTLVFGTGSFNKNDFYLLNNLRLAIGAPDTRNKLITEGKFVTRGILFDVNSDQIKPESYGTIKEIANVLSENASVRVKVIGHTDSDGDDKLNLDLSKRRAEAVKAALIKEFSIDGARIETDGKGESQPVDKEDTAVAKANNRRVEFVKL